jgi:tetratricopeptide (TPR) repeat protein
MLDSEYAEAHVMFGVYAARMGQSDQALKSFIRAVELEPNMSDYQANAALVLIAMGRLAEAEPYARRATRAAPSSAFAHFVRGMALVGQEQGTFEAVASLRIAVTQYPQAAGALRWAEEKLQR